MGDRGGACRLLVEKIERKRLLGRTRRRCEYNINVNLKEIGWERGLD